MILPNPQDAIHKAWMYRLLTAICDDDLLSHELAFKGGTCAAMLGWLDRFSIDLDFDYTGFDPQGVKTVRWNLEAIFKELGLGIKDKSTKVPQYFLRYPVNSERQRNTLKIDVTVPPLVPVNNKYEAYRLSEIDRVINCQTKESMFANKLVALIERYEKNGSIASRDLYDIDHFFLSGFNYDSAIILERRLPVVGDKDNTVKHFFTELREFIQYKFTQRMIDQDLNVLLPYKKFLSIRKNLKQEVTMFLNNEIDRLDHPVVS